MIGSHLSESSLNDYAEGRLTGAELVRAERHLAECGRCRDGANGLSALLERLHSLPRELDPAADLLPAIRVETLRRRAAWSRRRAFSRLWWQRAAAAAALVVAAATFTVIAMRSADERGAASLSSGGVPPAGGAARSERLGDASGDSAPLDELRRLEAEYARATRELLAAYREERERLGTGTVRLIEHNMRTVDRALRQSQRALRTDPDSRLLRELVLAAHRRRLDMLRRAAVVAAGIL